MFIWNLYVPSSGGCAGRGYRKNIGGGETAACTAPHPTSLALGHLPPGEGFSLSRKSQRRFLPLRHRCLAGEACLAPTRRTNLGLLKFGVHFRRGLVGAWACPARSNFIRQTGVAEGFPSRGRLLGWCFGFVPTAPHPSALTGCHLPPGEGFSQKNGDYILPYILNRGR